METSEMTALYVVLGGIVAYPLVMRLLSESVHKMRLQMIGNGKGLLSSPHLGERHKVVISSMLEDFHDWRVMMQVAAVLPVYLVKRFFFKNSLPHPPARVEDRETRKNYEWFITCYVRSTAAANPFFVIIVAFETALAVLVAFPFGLLWRLTDLAQLTVLSADDRANELR